MAARMTVSCSALTTSFAAVSAARRLVTATWACQQAAT